MSKKVLVLPGDGIGPEIVAEAVKVLEALNREGLGVELEQGLVGGAAYDETGSPLPERTLEQARAADAILLGAVGGPKWEPLERALRPEKGLLGLRAGLELFSNLRPAVLYPQLAEASTLRPEVVAGLDIMIVRELTGGIYFGEPRGIRTLENGERQGYNTWCTENRRSSASAVRLRDRPQARQAALLRGQGQRAGGHRAVARGDDPGGRDYPDVELSHMYVDNAAMQLVKWPKQFDVMVTDNMFGDILSDAAAMLTGSIGMLPSASLDAHGKGMYEPIHGSAPDIAGRAWPTRWPPSFPWP
jgi:3-isopropylmalate dehydrogenase